MMNNYIYNAILKLASGLEDNNSEIPTEENISLKEDPSLSSEELPTFTRENISGITERLIRPVPKTRAGLGVKPAIDSNGYLTGRGKSNIIRVFNESTEEERYYWGKWYLNAQQDVIKLANTFKVSLEVMAAIVATLSPGNKWVDNLLAAFKLMRGDKIIHAYPANIKKSLIIKNTNTPSVSGPKVTLFYKSLIDPESVKNDVVLDGHAINIWLGKKVNLKNVSVGKKLRKKIIEDYKKAAAEVGQSPQAVQAITWFIWKCLPYDVKVPPAPDSVNPENLK